jgi:hypothetical protein
MGDELLGPIDDPAIGVAPSRGPHRRCIADGAAFSQPPGARGLPWLVAGLAAVVVALTISLLKMGQWPWLRRMAVQFRLVSVAPENGKL